jgi:hypothetical protein
MWFDRTISLTEKHFQTNEFCLKFWIKKWYVTVQKTSVVESHDARYFYQFFVYMSKMSSITRSHYIECTLYYHKI